MGNPPEEAFSSSDKLGFKAVAFSLSSSKTRLMIVLIWLFLSLLVVSHQYAFKGDILIYFAVTFAFFLELKPLMFTMSLTEHGTSTLNWLCIKSESL